MMSLGRQQTTNKEKYLLVKVADTGPHAADRDWMLISSLFKYRKYLCVAIVLNMKKKSP